MKPYLRRKTVGGYPYYKLARWDERSQAFRDGKQTFATDHDAMLSVVNAGPGRYRLSRVTAEGRYDEKPFTVDG